jgi:hypothetical protein
MGHLPLIDIQESARGPELIGGDHGQGVSGSESEYNFYKLLLQASIQRQNISMKGAPRRSALRTGCHFGEALSRFARPS